MQKQPVRILEGTAKPHEPFWVVRDAAASESGEPEIDFYGYISEYSWFEDDITPAKFKTDLARIGQGGPVTIRIHSGGGDIFAASAIRSALIEYPGHVTTRIDGLCASAATYVATAGNRVLMQDSAYFMIHDPSTVVWGNIDDLKSAIDVLKTLKAGIIEAYQSKTTLDTEKLAAMMSAETWMTAQQAQEYGFVDEVITQPSKAFNGAQNMAAMNALQNYEHVPAELLSSVAGTAAAEDTSADAADEPDQRQVESLRAYLDIFS